MSITGLYRCFPVNVSAANDGDSFARCRVRVKRGKFRKTLPEENRFLSRLRLSVPNFHQ